MFRLVLLSLASLALGQEMCPPDVTCESPSTMYCPPPMSWYLTGMGTGSGPEMCPPPGHCMENMMYGWDGMTICPAECPLDCGPDMFVCPGARMMGGCYGPQTCAMTWEECPMDEVDWYGCPIDYTECPDSQYCMGQYDPMTGCYGPATCAPWEETCPNTWPECPEIEYPDCGAAEFPCTAGWDMYGCEMGATCSADGMCPPVPDMNGCMYPTEPLMPGEWDTICHVQNGPCWESYLMPGTEGCPATCPTECMHNEMMCDNPTWDNCPTTQYCMYDTLWMWDGSACMASCPPNCGENEVYCMGYSAPGECPGPDFCMPMEVGCPPMDM